MIKRILALALVAILVLAFGVTALAATPAAPVEENLFYAADYAGVLTDEVKAEIVSTNQTLRTSMGAEIVLVTVDSTGGQAIDEYAKDIGNNWGVGSKKYNNGMVLVFSIEEDDYYCAVGTGLESLVVQLPELLDSNLEVHFAAENYSEGALKCVKALAELVRLSGIGGEDYITGNDDYAFSGFRQHAAGGMSKGSAGSVGIVVLFIVILVLVLLIAVFSFAGSRHVYIGGGMPLWPFFFFGRRHFPPFFGGFHHHHHHGPRGPRGGGFGGFGGGGFGRGGGGFGGGGRFGGGGAGRK